LLSSSTFKSLKGLKTPDEEVDGFMDRS